MTTSPNPDDPRIRRTRRALHDAAIRLALTRGYDQLTVEELLALAEVSRPTFYAHFDDKWALLDSALDEAVASIRGATVAALVNESGAFTEAPMRAFFTAAAEHGDALRVVMRGGGHTHSLEAWTEQLTALAVLWFERQAAQLGRQPRVPVDLVARQFTWSVVATLSWWLDHHPEREADEVTELFRSSTLLGRAWAMGIDGDLHLPAADGTDGPTGG